MDAAVYEVVAVLVSFGIGVFVTKRHYLKLKHGLSEVCQCLQVIEQALKDDRITKEEVNRMVKECIKDLRRWI